jgi:hypothetical protein
MLKNHQKRVLMHLHMLPDHQKLFVKKDIFYRLEWLKRVLMHLHMLPDHQKLFFKKDFFERLECLKCVCMHLHSFSIKIFFAVWSG